MLLLRTLLLTLFFSLIHAEPHEKVILITIPKCGTNLLMRYLTELTGKNYYTDTRNFLVLDPLVNIGLWETGFCVCHAIASESNREVVENKGFKGVFIYRDPRDQVVSQANYIRSLPDQWPLISQLPLDELILHLILDTSIIRNDKLWNVPELDNFKGIDTFYSSYLDWLDHPLIYATTFEKLVGPQGGGTREAQITEVMKIAHHLGYHLSIERAESIAENLFGHTGTFSSGQIGSWKKYFNEEHKKVFKQVAGQLLIDLNYERDFDW